MVSLVDIVPQRRMVQIAAGDLELRGIGLRQIADLFLTFPALRNISGAAGAPDVTPEELLIQAPDAAGAIIAVAAGWQEPDAGEIITSGGMTPEDAADCLAAIRDLTFPRGMTPFFQKMKALLGGDPLYNVAALPTKGPDTIAPLVPNGSLPQGMAQLPK